MNNFVKTVADIVRVNEEFAFPTIADQYELVRQKLATVKEYGDEVLFKYHRNVMYDYAWNRSKHLMECRGHVYNKNNGELLVAPPRKSFNYGENGWWSEVPLDTPVFFAKKYNGFLACERHDGKISTTGSLDSAFVGYAEEIAKPVGFEKPEFTRHMEIVHTNDPHIVHEYVGAYTLCWRNRITGEQQPAESYWSYTLGEVLDITKERFDEGIMVYAQIDSKRLSPCKIKSPYYVGKKKLMRMVDKQVQKMYASPVEFAKANLPLEWKEAPSLIVAYHTKEEWLRLDAQARREWLEYEHGGIDPFNML